MDSADDLIFRLDKFYSALLDEAERGKIGHAPADGTAPAGPDLKDRLSLARDAAAWLVTREKLKPALPEAPQESRIDGMARSIFSGGDGADNGAAGNHPASRPAARGGAHQIKLRTGQPKYAGAKRKPTRADADAGGADGEAGRTAAE